MGTPADMHNTAQVWNSFTDYNRNGWAVSSSKCNKMKLIGPIRLEVKSVFREKQFSGTFPV